MHEGPNQKRFHQNQQFQNQQDPQIVLEGRFKRGENADTITCNYHLNELMELVIICTVPPEGETRAPVYIKHKVHHPRERIDYRVQADPRGRQSHHRPRREFSERDPMENEDDDELPETHQRSA